MGLPRHQITSETFMLIMSGIRVSSIRCPTVWIRRCLSRWIKRQRSVNAKEVRDDRIEVAPTVGYLSRVQSEKGASVYLKLAELNPHLIFLIAGPDMGRYASRKLPDNLVYVGFHPREKLPLIYNAFDVYCFLSMSGEETFGLTVLEAMACGVPPVVPNFDGVPSVVGDAGLVADAENFDRDIATLVSYPCPIDFSEKINLLLNSDKCGGHFLRKQGNGHCCSRGIRLRTALCSCLRNFIGKRNSSIQTDS